MNAALDAAMAWHNGGKQTAPNSQSVQHVDAILADRARLLAEVEQLRAQVSTAPIVGLRLTEPPSANRWWRSCVIPAKGDVPAHCMTYVSEEAREYKSAIAKIVRTEPYGCDVRVSIDWFRGRRSGDLDKRIGVTLDALQGSFYENDDQIVELRARRFDDPGRPRIVVRVDPVGAIQTSLLTTETAR
jgi:Holliday junction resolvase RusA-like endonuclease